MQVVDVPSLDRSPDRDHNPTQPSSPAEWDMGLTLDYHELGEDDNGLFIHGALKNTSQNSYDAIQIEFELCDNKENAFSILKERLLEELTPGESWNFTTYIPYTDRSQFSSYRIYNVTAVKTAR